MSYGSNSNDTATARRTAEASLRNSPPRTDASVTTGIPFWDLMLSFGKASQQALTSYGVAAERTGYAERAAYAERSEQANQTARHVASNVEVIPVGEETLHVGTRLVSGDTTRVRRVVVETPVEQSVSLREERVIVERRKPTAAGGTAPQGLFTETAIEMSDSFEVVEVWKSSRVTEEVVLRREVTERTETVRDIVRHDEVVVEQARATLSAPHRESETAQQGYKAPQPAKTVDPAQLSADLKKVAERFETDANQPSKTPAALRPEGSAQKSEPSPMARQQNGEQQKTGAEQPKAPAQGARPDTSNEQNDKAGPGRKV